MTTFNDAVGSPVITKATAEQVGVVKHFVVQDGYIRAIHVDGGKRDGRLIAWADIAGFGEDAVVIEQDDVLAVAADDREHDALRGDLVMVGKRLLDDAGDDLGEVADVSFDAGDGRVESLTADGEVIDGGRLRGVGSYAVVVAAGDER